MEIIVNKQKLSSEKTKQLSSVLSDAFEHDPVMGSIFRNKREIRKFMVFMLKYFNIFGEIHYTNDLTGVALWLKPGEGFITVKNMFSKGMKKDVIKFLFSVSIFSLLRLFKISDFLTEQKPMDNHYYLFAIGSITKGKGIGKKLMNFAINRFGDKHKYYLENTNIVNNTFYQKFAFNLTERAYYKGRKFFLMIRDAESNIKSIEKSPNSKSYEYRA